MEFKKYVDGNMITEEMAKVYRNDTTGYEIRIYTEPLGNPSFHVLYKDVWEVVLQIKDLKVLEIKHGKLFKKGEFLPVNIKKDIINILNEYRKGRLTYWDFLLITWNAINEKFPVDESMRIPK